MIKDDILEAEICTLKQFRLLKSLLLFLFSNELVIVLGLCGVWKMKGLKADWKCWIKKFEQVGQVLGASSSIMLLQWKENGRRKWEGFCNGNMHE